MPTTNRGYPYPLSTAVADVPADLLLLANALNTDVDQEMLKNIMGVN